ncbi:PD-(D/E)XK motif protein [Paenibacillus xerothermodurans]|uniref:PD-(D/E)XK motif protein n=1 Tax=Paenibacillus xerothermodurans TaxID=1977292 RepID=A0A2W1N6V8_PAEXE|nr:PD-(D/E)XK motif protein [Paenibacillus xerothermodurans]PZE20329.1 PD-(D/E)XK motif protein [Paenibacillus xerothermodurans]
MTNNDNPWLNMGSSSQRRAISNTPHNLFWVTDLDGHCGFCIQTKDTTVATNRKLNLKGITIVTRNIPPQGNELFLILNTNEDWQIFHALCQDLITVIKREIDHRKMITAVENRLKRWQLIMQQDHKLFSLEKQMGLFSELLCLKEVASAKVGIRDAVISWGGPDFDKQDFLMSNCAIEVKSHRTSKGETVSISSMQQLQCDKEPFYLMSYALTISEKGKSVEDILKEIIKILESGHIDLIDVFENKVIQYGYISEIIREPLNKFIVDSQKIFRVSDSFPKITPASVKREISSAQYTIDLSQCSEFEINLENFLREGGTVQ